MAQFESGVKYVPYSQERVFNKLSDLSNLESVREKLADKVQGMEFDRDSLSFTVQGINITLCIIEREPYKCIKFESGKSPLPMNLWIQILPVEAEQAKLKVTLRAEVNMFMKTMVSKPLQEGVDKLAEMLSMISY
ncbi:SRPBCC family protein [Phocaeicola sp.]|uniref:SRPBCC family protein n=1 Tax=Phocaeicola sp. TaxID=2773926 RepID=UPI0023CFB3E6|nr:SRPBCC family protein [Phocaeicola sp.]MDE5677426.1 SRPBCC family protein [Phocaeicola sp.]